MNEIIENIEEIRDKKGYKQAYMADKMGVTQGAYSNYVNRSQDIPFNRLKQIANIFDCSVVDIITYPEKYVPESEIKKDCEICDRKDKIIQNLTEYIEVLKKKK